MNRRELMFGAAGAASLAAAPVLHAQPTYPSRPITWVVPWPAGGGADFVARTLADQLGRGLGQPVVVDNRPGASGIIGAQAVARASPDGYTVFQGDNGPLVFNPALFAKLPYDPVRDFAPITMIVRYPLVLVAANSVPASNAKELFALAKAQPGKLNYASIGIGNAFHLAMELLKERTQTYIVQVPYRGAGPAIQGLLAGEVELSVVDTAAALPYIRTGKLKALGLLTAGRQAQLPEVPTMTEMGISGVEVYAWQAMMAPAATPAPAVKRLHDELVKVLGSAETKSKFADKGIEPVSSTPEQVAAYMREEAALWQPLIKARGIKLG